VKSKSNYLTVAVLLIFALLLAPYAVSKDSAVVLRGQIMDSQCAYNVHSSGHSHDLMMKGNVEGTNNEESCTKHCVKDMGGSYVLLAKKEVYKLEENNRLDHFAGKKVKISGSMNPDNTLHIQTIEEDK